MKLIKREVAKPQGDLFGAGDAQSLSLFPDLDKVLNKELATFEIGAVAVTDLDFAARRRLDRSGDVKTAIVLKIDPGNCDVGWAGASPIDRAHSSATCGGTVSSRGFAQDFAQNSIGERLETSFK